MDDIPLLVLYKEIAKMRRYRYNRHEVSQTDLY